ncbi:copper amine oxidase N-terminal domain-containing protein [Cohnella mopanensis]|uniref:copper amine oxidase N-terminal domain-containing protein n=1 Tax=Cohnella mopanensis TaxID=2911966 RepID=UPI001EF7F061
MFKKTIATLVAAAVIGGFGLNSVNAAAINEGQIIIPIIVNGHKVKFPDTEPYVDENGRTMVPVRFVSESLGATVKWDNATRTATITNGTKTISLAIGSKTVSDNGQVVELDTAAAMVDGRTMVPLRFVSESMNSKVTWDKGGNAVQISDSAYQAKIDNGTVKLDAWGRELATADDKWNKLADLPSFVYELSAPRELSNKEFIKEVGSTWADKTHIDMWAGKIRKYYQAQLNIDYRTIDESSFISALQNEMELGSSYDKFYITKAMKEYVAWVKTNHVIAKGYADPENSLVGYIFGGPVFRTHFKFMVVQADDTAQVFMDNTEVSKWSDSFKLKTGVWYEGYADVTMGTHFGSSPENHFALNANENMFSKGRYVYNEVK